MEFIEDLTIHELENFSGLQGSTEQLLRMVCELNHWEWVGHYPNFYIERHVHLTFSGKEEVLYRLVNARSHHYLRELTFGTLQSMLKGELDKAKAYQVDPLTFLQKIRQVYQKLSHFTTAPIPLAMLYDHLYSQNPTYSREQFGLALAQALASGIQTIENQHLVVYPARQTAQSFYVFDQTGCGQYIESIQFE